MAMLQDAGFAITATDVKVAAGLTVTCVAEDRDGVEWLFDVVGGFTSTRSGLSRSETLWKTLGKVAVVAAEKAPHRYVLLTTDLPTGGSAQGQALAAVTGRSITAALDLTDPETIPALEEWAG